MKTLYLECSMGAAGDMLMSALYELLEDKAGFLRTMNGLGLPGVRLEAKSASTRRSMSPPPRRRPPTSMAAIRSTTTTMNTTTTTSTATRTPMTIRRPIITTITPRRDILRS